MKSNYTKDYVLIGLCLAIMTVTNCTVQDSRTFTLPVNIVEKASKEVIKHIQDVHYLVYDQEETIEEVDNAPTSEEVEVSEAIFLEESIESELQDYTEESEVVEEESGLINNEVWTYLGTYEITAYEWTGSPCANGNYPSEGYTVACNDLPFGTTVYIDGVGYRVVEDRGGGGYGWMDIYMGDVGACYEWGRQYRDVWLVE